MRLLILSFLSITLHVSAMEYDCGEAFAKSVVGKIERALISNNKKLEVELDMGVAQKGRLSITLEENFTEDMISEILNDDLQVHRLTKYQIKEYKDLLKELKNDSFLRIFRVKTKYQAEGSYDQVDSRKRLARGSHRRTYELRLKDTNLGCEFLSAKRIQSSLVR